MELEAARVNAPDLRRVGLHPDFWYPLARSTDLPRGQTRLALFGGEPIVIARGEDGRVFALDDRCAHRQYPLHQGVVTGNRLRCAYHAWSYGADGCAAVPYLPRGACRPRGVKSYACQRSLRLRVRFPGRPAPGGEGAAPRVAGVPFAATARHALLAQGRLPLLVHAREPDGHAPSVPAPRDPRHASSLSWSITGVGPTGSRRAIAFAAAAAGATAAPTSCLPARAPALARPTTRI